MIYKEPPLPRRYTELDSMRGIAALTVVFHHFALMWLPVGGYTGWRQMMVRVLNPLATGHEAVVLFFLLSGFVLSVPYLSGKSQGYFTYLLRRILRIYGPYVFALGLAVAGAMVWHTSLGRSAWTDRTWSRPVSGRLVLEHLGFIGVFDDVQYNTAFWSLVLEMRISIVFPLLFAVVMFLPAWGAGVLAAGLALAGWLTLQTAAIFVVGILLAKHTEAVSEWYGKLSVGSRVGMLLGSFVVYTWGHHANSFVSARWGADVWAITLGAAGFVVTALNSARVGGVLNSRLPRFLGRISYSLYLVHGTVLFALTHVLQRRLPAAVQFFIYLALSIGLGYLFCVAIEEPFMRMGRRVSRWSNRRRAGDFVGVGAETSGSR